MRLTVVQKTLLNNIRVMLLASCHAPGCMRISKCPNQCSCRTRRIFALNTETCICWEIADKIQEVLTWGNPNRQEIRDFVTSTRAYADITRFHMTKGWQNFFQELYMCINKITNPKSTPEQITREKHTITYLKNTLGRVKRYLKLNI